jgi:hypothetical protein
MQRHPFPDADQAVPEPDRGRGTITVVHNLDVEGIGQGAAGR